MKKLFATASAAFALLASSSALAETWTFETDQATFTVVDSTNFWDSVSMSTSRSDLYTHFFYVLDAVTVKFTFTGPSGSSLADYPQIDYVEKGEWRYTGILGDIRGEDPYSHGLTFGERKNFYDRWGPIFPVPEPSSYAMMGLGLGIIALRALRRRREKN